MENEDYRSHTRSLFYQWKTFGIYDIVNLNSMVFYFPVDRQLDTSGHVLEEVGLCERLSEDLVTTPSLQVSFLTGRSVSSQMS